MLTICKECGFKAEELQFQKTNGFCPVCNPKEAKAFRQKLIDKGKSHKVGGGFA